MWEVTRESDGEGRGVLGSVAVVTAASVLREMSSSILNTSKLDCLDCEDQNRWEPTCGNLRGEAPEVVNYRLDGGGAMCTNVTTGCN